MPRTIHQGRRKVAKPHQAGTGQGARGAHRLSVLEPGPLDSMGIPRHVADMYADVFPYLSLAGLDIYREEDRRGTTMRDGDESHIQARTGGKISPKQRDNRTHHARIDPLVQYRGGRKG